MSEQSGSYVGSLLLFAFSILLVSAIGLADVIMMLGRKIDGADKAKRNFTKSIEVG